MIDTDKYENMRLLFLDFIDTASDEVDEEAWRDKLTMLDELLAEVKRLRSIADDLYAYIVSDADISLSTIEEQMDWGEEE